MATRIIAQPNGKYCIFSTYVDNITHYDMSVEEIIEEWTNDAKKEIAERVNSVVTSFETGERSPYQFTQSYEDTLKLIKECHGKTESEKVKSLIEGKSN